MVGALRLLAFVLLGVSVASAQTAPVSPELAARTQHAESRRVGCEQLLKSGQAPDSPYPPGHRALVRNCMWSDTPLPP